MAGYPVSAARRGGPLRLPQGPGREDPPTGSRPRAPFEMAPPAPRPLLQTGDPQLPGAHQDGVLQVDHGPLLDRGVDPCAADILALAEHRRADSVGAQIPAEDVYRDLEALFLGLGRRIPIGDDDATERVRGSCSFVGMTGYGASAPAKELFPLGNFDDVLKAAYIPTDGHIDPTGVTHALAKGATSKGAEMH